MAKKSNANAIASYDDSKWRIESDLRTLVEAAEIRKDSKRFKPAQALARTRAAEMKTVAEAAGSATKKE